MFESLVCGARIHQIRQCQLLNVTKPLERCRIDDASFVRVKTNEHMDRIANLVNVLHENYSEFFRWLADVPGTSCLNGS